MKRKTSFLVCAMLFATVLFAAEPNVLRVGVSPTSPPIQYMERNKVVGLESDFAHALGKELGRPIVFVDLKFRELIPALLNSEIDIIMSGMSVTRVRDMQVAFAQPYMTIGQMPLVRLEDRNTFTLPVDIIMTSKRVGATENTTSEYLLVQEFPNAKKTLFTSQAKAEAALKRGSIDLLILDSPLIMWMAMKNEGKLTPIPVYLTEENLAWAVRKADKQLLEQLNDTLLKWKETGQLDAMIKERIPRFN